MERVRPPRIGARSARIPVGDLRMRLSRIEGIQPGMHLAEHIYLDDGRLLAAAGTALTQDGINVIKAQGFTTLVVHEDDTEDIEVPEVISGDLRRDLSVRLRQAYDVVRRRLTSQVDKPPTQILKSIHGADLQRDFASINLYQWLEPLAETMLVELASVSVIDGLSMWRRPDPFQIDHSVNVAAASIALAFQIPVSGQRRTELGLGALLHDIGKCAIDNRLLNKAADLSHAERLEFETHSFQTEFILSHGNPFRTFGALPSTAEERLDGSGYHRRNEQKGLRENLLAAANLYDELVFDSPGKPALSAKDATERLTEQSKSGALMPTAVAAVLQAAGSPVKTARKALPFGLSRREAQVIACLARSETTPQIAARLGISAKTADHHIQSIYSKTGVRGRASIAILAIEHGLGSDEKELAWDTIKRKWLKR